MTSFVQGELVVMQNATYFHDWDGAIGVVVGTLTARSAKDLSRDRNVTLNAYKVKVVIEGGIEVVCEPHQIRKLVDPDEQTEKPATQDMESPETASID